MLPKFKVRKDEGTSHFCSQARNWSCELGARKKEEEGRRKEPEEVFLQI